MRRAWLVVAAVVVLGALGSALWWSLGLASLAPEPDEWRELWRDPAPALSWSEVLLPAERAFEPLLRALQRALLEAPWPLAGTALVGWLAALAVWLSVVVLARRTAPGAARIGVPLLSLMLFAPAFGADWLLEQRVRVFLPAACAALAVAVLALARSPRLAFVGAGSLAIAAAGCGGDGAWAWLGLLPLVWGEARRRTPDAVGRVVVTWVALGNVLVALSRIDATAAPGVVAHLGREPIGALSHGLAIVGGVAFDLVPASSADDVSVGALCVLAFAAGAIVLASPGGRGHRTPALPWLAVALIGFVYAANALARWHPPFVAAPLQREATWGVLLAPIGVLGTWSCLCRGRGRVWLAGCAMLALIAIGIDHVRGRAQLGREHAMLRQGEATMAFAELDGVQRAAHPRVPVEPAGARRALRAAGRLRDVAALDSARLDEWRREPAGPDPIGAVARREPTGTAGWVALSDAGFRCDLVALSRAFSDDTQRFFALGAPDLFTDARVGVWSIAHQDVRELGGDVVVRAWAVDARRRSVRYIGEGFGAAVDGSSGGGR